MWFDGTQTREIKFGEVEEVMKNLENFAARLLSTSLGSFGNDSYENKSKIERVKGV